MNLEEVYDKYTEAKAQTSIILSEIEDSGAKYVVVEAPAEGLRFLAEVLLAWAQEEEHCDHFIHPGNPGSIWFDKRSPMGLFIHRLPCKDGVFSQVEDEPGDRPEPSEPPADG